MSADIAATMPTHEYTYFCICRFCPCISHFFCFLWGATLVLEQCFDVLQSSNERLVLWMVATFGLQKSIGMWAQHVVQELMRGASRSPRQTVSNRLSRLRLVVRSLHENRSKTFGVKTSPASYFLVPPPLPPVPPLVSPHYNEQPRRMIL